MIGYLFKIIFDGYSIMKFSFWFTLLFAYIIAAVLFWGYSLQRQSREIYKLQMKNLSLQESLLHEIKKAEAQHITQMQERRRKQYLGEGAFNLGIILLGSAVVLWAYYKQQRLNRLQQNFMLSVTHELKTPIAGIKLNLQTLLKRQLAEDVQKKLLNSSVQESDRLNDLCSNIITATQLEDRKQALYSDEVQVSVLLNELIDEQVRRFPNFMVERAISNKDELRKGDMFLWRLMLSNLIENARKYSPEGEPVRISMQAQGDQWLLQIADHGPGIPDEEKKRIFDKFYRMGDEQTRLSKGTGLGLFIVKKIVDLYKYDIMVKNNRPLGTIFELRF